MPPVARPQARNKSIHFLHVKELLSMKGAGLFHLAAIQLRDLLFGEAERF